ncbi:MAG: 5'/3'-nucleotidase SurE, partial [Muribaculaceae bacterium]|nr:5'/3'-nucleotidase SurE [Muribaculaceae bacterium]
VGFSLLHHSLQADFSECLPFVRGISERVLRSGLPEGVCLNVNFPAKVRIKGLKVVRSARSRWTEEYQEYTDPHGKPFFWLTGNQVNEEPDADDTDLHWLALDYATAVPTRPDQNATEAIAGIAGLLG